MGEICVATEQLLIEIAPLVAKKALALDVDIAGDQYVDEYSPASRIQLLTICTFQPQICLGAFLADPQGFFDLLMSY